MTRIKLTRTEKQVTMYDVCGKPLWIKALKDLDASDNHTSARIFDEGKYRDYCVLERITGVEIDGYTGIISIYYESGAYLEIMSINKQNPAAILMHAAEKLKEYEQTKTA